MNRETVILTLITLSLSLINENAEYIKNCSTFVNDALMENYMGDHDLISQSAILEGSRIDLALKNFLKEGKDYKGLKNDLRTIIDVNNLDDKYLTSGSSKFIHICKRIIQVLLDIDAAVIPAAAVAGGVGSAVAATMVGGISIPLVIIIAILDFVVSFIVNRLLRYLVDTIEFDTIRNDTKEIISDLRSKADDTDDEKLKKKYLENANKLSEALKKHSKAK